MPIVYKFGAERFVYPIDLKANLEDGWSLESNLGTDLGQDRIKINSATLDELRSLEGIGVAKAQTIIDNRPYSNLADLKALELALINWDNLENLISFEE